MKTLDTEETRSGCPHASPVSGTEFHTEFYPDIYVADIYVGRGQAARGSTVHAFGKVLMKEWKTWPPGASR